MPRKPVEKPVILCDSREQLGVERLFSPAVAFETGVTLSTGDYSLRSLTHRVAWERKSIADLVMSCTSERARFQECVERLSRYRYKAILVEGTREEIWAHAYRSQATPQSIIGSTRSFLIDWNVPTIWCGSPRGVAEELEWMALRVSKLEKRRSELAALAAQAAQAAQAEGE
jgi:DNA excision repair protein ERCC-4